jgi:hypothetical protein
MAVPIEKGVFRLRPYTIAELAIVYGVCKRTLRKWLKPFLADIGKRQGHFYSIAQVKIIIDKIGLPGDLPLNN